MAGKRRADMTQAELDYAREYDRRRSARYKLYYESHRAKILERCKARRLGPEGDHMRALQNKRYSKRRDEMIAYMKSTGYRAQKKWKAKNLHKLREYTRRRHALKMALGAGPVDYAQIYKDSGGICGICHEAFMVYDEIHFDHIVPLSRGGAHTAENIQATHAKCNLKKFNKVAA